MNGAAIADRSSVPDHVSRPDVGNETSLRVLFDVGHPAQVHLFRNAVEELQRRGHETLVASREKEVTVELLDAYDIEHVALTTRGTSLPSLLWELALREVRLLSVAKSFQPDVIVSRLSPAAAHVSKIVGCKNVVINDTRIHSKPMRILYHRLTLPFVDAVYSPADFDLPVPRDKSKTLDFQELAYLHPRYFDPDPTIPLEYDIDPDGPYFIIRLAGWDAYHDIGHAGLSPEGTRELVSYLSEFGTVYISAEGTLPADLLQYELPTRPEDIHHLLYYANMYVGDSGTMSTEAAMLGTPAIRTNTMVSRDENVFRELEHRYELLQSFADEEAAIAAVKRLLEGGIDRTEWRNRRARMIDEQPDVTNEIVEAILDASPKTDYETIHE